MEPRLVGLPGTGAWAMLARCLLSGRPLPGFPALELPGRLVLVLGSQEELEDAADAFAALGPVFDGAAEACAVFGEEERGRLASLQLLREGARLAVASVQALAGPLPAPESFAGHTLRLKVDQRLRRDDAAERLSRSGYQRVDFVESAGEFAVRGAVLDFFAVEPARAVRVLFDEDTVASLRTFDPGTQATQDMISEAVAVPAHEAVEGGSGSLADWVGADAVWVAAEGVEMPALPPGTRLYRGARLLELSAGDADFGARSLPLPKGDPAAAWALMKARAAEGWRVLLFSLNRGEDRRVQELLEERLPAGACQFLIGPLREGFEHPGLRLSVLATSEVFGRHYRSAARWKYFSAQGRGGLKWRELRQGDYVVHQDYGVSRYRGLMPVESPGHGVVDCLQLEFRGSDTLYIPMTEFSRVQKYSGAEGKRPRLSSLDTRKWEEVKRGVKEGVRELAEQLLKLQAKRAAQLGHAFPPQTPMEREFAEAFPFDETPDQARAIADVLGDMMSPHPMDRVVIGDVGFGKTEVAMRACFKCVAGFKQAVVLVPTTILADQHYRTFTARFADYPVKIGILTRFQTPAEQKRVLAGLKDGKLEIVIGTSRLLQKDVAFQDLGLAVIDEEHRFGVKDKERLKQLRHNVDVLALSATPIPRTLNQAMAGLRGLSLIESAPMGRQPISTKVGPWNEDVVAQAIGEELGRGGQVYYVHNRVRSLGEALDRLKRLVPQARFGMVHGQMRGPQIEKSMWDFFNREFDVLVASTIIESGLDNPAVNTLLVEDAHEFGLAQLYQLRGRIGRERQRAFCYFFYPEAYADFTALSEEARKRLEALKEFAQLGAGVKLALRDLEIRGAGELLGARQHGFINAVGVDYYSQLLTDEIARRRGQAAPDQKEVELDIRAPAFIPESYLPGELERLDFYKRILRAGAQDWAALQRELEDLSGPAPQPVANLFSLLKVRDMARRAGARSVLQRGKLMEIRFSSDAPVGAEQLAAWTKKYKESLRFLHEKEGDGVVVPVGDGEPLDWLEGFFLDLLGRREKMIRSGQ